MGNEKEPEEKPVENGKEEKNEKNGKEEKNEKNGKEEKDEKPTENGDVDTDSKKKAEKEPAAEEDGEESEDEEPGPGILDKPVEILTTKRERKSTDFLVHNRTVEAPLAPEDEVDYTKGKGTMLKDIPYIMWQINRADTEDLHVLHKLMYKKTSEVSFHKEKYSKLLWIPF